MPATAALLVLKENEVFIVSDEAGELAAAETNGLYYNDTRYLSVLAYQINGQALILLGSESGQGYLDTLYAANEQQTSETGQSLLPQTISVRRERFVRDGLHERATLTNFNPFAVHIELALTCGNDFRDMFDVRGFRREQWGTLRTPSWDGAQLVMGYDGLDGVYRATQINFDPAPATLDLHVPLTQVAHTEPGVLVPAVGAATQRAVIQPVQATARWTIALEPGAAFTLVFQARPHGMGAPEPVAADFAAEADHVRGLYAGWRADTTQITSSWPLLDAALARGAADLRLLSQITDGGYFPHAGVPWYVSPFGRDSLLTGILSLMLTPKLALAALRVLARHQGHTSDPWREEQPGKILHEVRFGEMARLGLIPHTPYFGSVDATPLFIIAFVELLRWMDDDTVYAELLPHVRRALAWIDTYGDVDGDGFYEYVESTTFGGIRNQVWKDSHDSYTMPDGTLADTPLAACEVQGYVYMAKQGLGKLVRGKGESAWADQLAGEAAALKARFNSAFWLPDRDCLAQGLDAAKRPIQTISSNAGQCLWTGIVDDDKAAVLAARLLAPDMLSGWGIRTISALSPSYNPMSYHNGSVWPHDNALIVAGLARYGFHAAAATVARQLLEAAAHFRYTRLPELYCGFAREGLDAGGPVAYPVSCSPQAWAAATPFLLLQSLLGLEPQPSADGPHPTLVPNLMPELAHLVLTNLPVGRNRLRVAIGPDGLAVRSDEA